MGKKVFDNWRTQLKWQLLKPCEAFAPMIKRQWDGLRDEDYLCLKVLTCMLPKL